MQSLPFNMIELNQSFKTKEEMTRYYGQKLVEAECVDEGYIDAMVEGDDMLPIYVGSSITILHGADKAKKHVKRPDIHVVRMSDGINFGTEEGGKIAIVLFGVVGVGDEHLQLVQQITLYRSGIDNVVQLAGAFSKEEVMENLTIV